MNKLATSERAQILNMLCEGMAIRAVARVTGKSKNTITKLLVNAGKVCSSYQDTALRDLQTKRVEVDEIWSFVYAKNKNVATATSAPEGAGDVWTWTAIDADSKLVMSWLVGGRDSEYALAFMDNLKGRLANRVQLTSDGHKAYLEAVEEAFGADVDYAQLIKMYGNAPGEAKGRYSPAECTGIKKRRVEGDPDIEKVSTSYVERQNLTMRMHMRRFTRLTNAFSKKVANHEASIALHFMYYNFVKIHKTLKCTPAMAAGVTLNLWNMEDVVKLIEAEEDKAPKKRGSYKK
ncbi:IS1 family transposase [uncultured Algimonas sp.]|uniref:IS1 family transposase n=1 Tax=uncultured Algimonas sp. TaxID=1547920 RepID=UPI002608C3FD|nr:IS1 family transposase [uncultured Algimonas sp.]